MKLEDFEGKSPTEIAKFMMQNIVTKDYGVIATGQAYLQAKLNEDLINAQKGYQEKSIIQTRKLVIATWIIALATLVTAAVNIYIQFKMLGN